MTAASIAALLVGRNHENALRNCLLKRDVVLHHGDVSRLPWIADDQRFESIQQFAHCLAESADTQVLLYRGVNRDESYVSTIRAPELPAGLDGRPMFSVGPLEDVVPSVREPLLQLRSEVGLGPLSATRAIAYGSFAGPGAAWHWDAGLNVVTQLVGHKRWHVAPPVMSNPPDRYSVLMATWPERLQPHVQGPPPVDGPSSSRTIDLEPGSVLVLPPGWWHRTEASGESLALNFTYGTPDRAQVLARYLTRRLRSDERWRHAVRHTGLGAAAASHQLDAYRLLLRELADELSVLDPAMVIEMINES